MQKKNWEYNSAFLIFVRCTGAGEGGGRILLSDGDLLLRLVGDVNPRKANYQPPLPIPSHHPYPPYKNSTPNQYLTLPSLSLHIPLIRFLFSVFGTLYRYPSLLYEAFSRDGMGGVLIFFLFFGKLEFCWFMGGFWGGELEEELMTAKRKKIGKKNGTAYHIHSAAL